MRDSYSYTIEEHPVYGKVYVMRIHPNMWKTYKGYMAELDIELEQNASDII